MVTLSLFLLNGMIASSRYSDASNGPTVNINYTDNVTYCKKRKGTHLPPRRKKKEKKGGVGWRGGGEGLGWRETAKDRTT